MYWISDSPESALTYVLTLLNLTCRSATDLDLRGAGRLTYGAFTSQSPSVCHRVLDNITAMQRPAPFDEIRMRDSVLGVEA